MIKALFALMVMGALVAPPTTPDLGTDGTDTLLSQRPMECTTNWNALLRARELDKVSWLNSAPARDTWGADSRRQSLERHSLKIA